MKWNVDKPDEEGTPLGRKCTRCSGGTCGYSCYRESYKSSYSGNKHLHKNDNLPTWQNVSTTIDRSRCARILLGSVCLIWSGLTYMHWTGKWAKGSPYWNNHILDGTGLDDGTLSQWLQALGFPKDMLNDKGPKNRLDQVIWDGFRDMLFLGFLEPSGLSGDDVKDDNGNTARSPFGMNYAGFVHTAHRDSFNTDQATVFPNGTSSSSAGQISETNQHKNGAIFKLYILSCAYFTGLQKKGPPKGDNRNPKTIREILYWLSALPYSTAYPKILKHSIERLKSVAPVVGDKKQLSFYQTGRNHPITVHEFNLFAHFQAVTQYCPLVLIGIQGGIHITKGTKEPPIHSLYANTECSFTYPTVSIQAYNQVVHYIRALFYQLYFLRKQCAVKVTCGGKWRECRYGSGVVSKGVISWMCLGCNPMEHDRKWRVEKVNGELGKVVSSGKSDDVAVKVKDVLEKIGDVVVQLGNAQEALEGKAESKVIEGVKEALEGAKQGLGQVNGGLDVKLQEAKTKLGELTNGSGGALHTLVNGGGAGSLQQIANADADWKKEYSSAKDKISEAIDGVREVLRALEKEVPEVDDSTNLNGHKKMFSGAIKAILEIVGSTRCVHCQDHANKCGKTPTPSVCDKCHQQYMDGTPSPLQAFLEDRLPGFSCRSTMDELDKQEADRAQKGRDAPPGSELSYPSAASHLGHCNGSGQCCPLPMGFRGQFQKRVTNTGQRLYGILYFFSNENMMQSCVYTLVRVTAALSATTPQVLGDVFGFFRGGVGNKEEGENKEKKKTKCGHDGNPGDKGNENKYFCGWCASGLRDEVKKIEWIPKGGDSDKGGHYMDKVGKALRDIKGDKDSAVALKSTTTTTTTNTSFSRLTENCHYLSPLTGELYTAVSATFGGTYLSWVLYLSDALQWGLESLASAFKEIECRGCRECDPNKCKKGSHGGTDSAQCNCSSIVSCTGVLPVLYRHGFSYGNPFNLEGYHQKDGKTDGQYDIEDTKKARRCHEFLESLQDVINQKEEATSQDHPLTNLLSQVGKLQYDIRLPWIFVLTLAWLVAVLYLAFGAIWPLDWTHMRSHCRGWFRKGSLSPWEVLMVGKKKGRGILEFFGKT
ncbi:variant erythrocyte surface antigen-1 alpha subunit [Babesia bovis T2Bo]|uniref:Variant erythrocyte surface antigen-1, alpha subunit n=1 Tax=Babesia bovis TaxID=5865 RepID=A7AXD4_BABBO|nr:variant erythrocyte surface antigen-1 alpha subunit [Babesia bovis T2Bo]EDO05207.1 variant erythrocyte surface antigen-1 alpha subunit [Babesia bovis T2Bo]|eukprot:XP_001608775.1 variant erythrocyte surface antigen-1, alpha subunit [Babesia bovis T2Bo]